MSRKISQRFFPSTLSFAFALSLLAHTSAQATTPVKLTNSPGSPKAPLVAKTPAKLGTIVGVASSVSEFSTLVTAVKAAGLVDTLSSPGPFTVFAPTNAAFAKLPKGTLQALLKPANKAKLVKVLTYHVVSGKVPSSAIKPGAVRTVEGSTVDLKVKGGKVYVNKAQVLKADVPASNGVIHVIDTVILPPDL